MPQPITFGADRKAQFTEYLCTDITRALMDRGALERKWAMWLDQYRAPANTAIKDFPWHGASNRTLPFTAMNADPLIARFVTTLHAPPNLWSLQPLNERWVDVAKPMQDYLQYMDERTLHMYDVDYRAIVEFIKLGTCIYKTGWFFERRKKLGYDQTGQLVPQDEFLSNPFVDHVSLVDFLLPPEALHIQADMQGGAQWVAERFWMRQGEFLARAQGQEPYLPNYDPAAVDLVKRFVESSRSVGGEVEDTRYRLDNNIPSHLRRIELFEAHCRFDCTGEGTVDDVVAVVHLPSRTLLRVIVNPYRHGKRPYTAARYFRGDGFYGIGECEQSEVFQEMLTLLWNYQMDNVLAVNAPMLGVKLGANVVANEPIYPLKIWALDDPSTDIREVKLSEVYPSLSNFSAIIQAWGERRTGINDVQLGNIESLPSRTPATSMMSMLQEGNRRFDLSLKELRDAMDEIGLRTLQNMQQFMSNPIQNPQAVYQLQMAIMALGEPEGSFVASMLTMPLEDIEAGIGVAVTATSGSVNKEVEKQAWIALAGLNAQFGQQYLTLAQILGNPQLQLMAPVVVQCAAQVFKGTSEIQRRLLEQFDIRNPEEILVNAAVLIDTAAQTAPVTQALALGAASAGVTAGSNGGQSGGAGAAGGLDGLAMLLTGAQPPAPATGRKGA